MNLREVYEPRPDVYKKTSDLKLRPFEWELLGCIDGKKTAAEVGVLLNLSSVVLEDTFAKLLQLQFIQITELGWEEFVQRYSTPEHPLNPAPTNPSAQPAPAPVPPPIPDAPVIEFSLKKAPEPAPGTTPSLPFTLEAPTPNAL
jgi:hypothetical protein